MDAQLLRMSGIRRNEHNGGFSSGDLGKVPTAPQTLDQLVVVYLDIQRARIHQIRHTAAVENVGALDRLEEPAAGTVQYVFRSAERLNRHARRRHLVEIARTHEFQK